MPIDLYFVRHGQAAANRLHRLCGSSIDPPLTPTGMDQAMNCLYALSLLKPDAIYCSPLLRARQTAEIATKGIANCPDIICDTRLLERDFGEIDGTFSLLKLKKVWNYNQSYIKSNYGEETLLSLELRVLSFLEMLKENHQDQTVIAFSHGGVGTTIHAILSEGHERSGWFFKHFHMKNGAITHFLL